MTGTTSAVIGAYVDIFRDTTYLVLEPYREFRRSRLDVPGLNPNPVNSSSPVAAAAASSSTGTSLSSPQEQAVVDQMMRVLITDDERRRDWQTGGAVAAATAKSLGKFLAHYYRAMMVDIPLATAEGFRAVPRLYGERVRDHGVVRDWKTGAIVGGKHFVYGMAEGISDIVTQPYKGAKEGGALGLVKGLAKGTIGVATKTPAGT